MGENLKEELENVTVQLEELRKNKTERMNQFKLHRSSGTCPNN